MQHAIVSRLGAVPGAVSAAFADIAPLDPTNRRSDTVLIVDGRTSAPGQASPLRRFEFISPGFFHTLGITIVTGRDLTWSDLYDRRMVAVVSENLAREEWQSPAAAIGKRVRASPGDPWREIVGVVRNVRDNGMHLDSPRIVYFPALVDRFWGAPTLSFQTATFLIRSPRAGTEGFLRDVHTAVWAVNRNLPLAEIRTLDESSRRSLARTSFALVMLAIAGGMGLLLGAIGIYGVIAYVASQRTAEIGIRLALGARASQVRSQFLREGLRLATAGVVIGLAAAAGLTRWMSSLLFGVNRLDPLTYLVVTVVLVAVAMVAVYLPAWRASRKDPIAALRSS
jgi:predicted permease